MSEKLLFSECEEIIRRKARRIERASNQVDYLRYDIETIKEGEFSKKVKEYLLWLIDNRVLPYLQNDDKEDNKYNRDSYNKDNFNR